LKASLEKLEDELRFVLIVSDVHLHGMDEKPDTAIETEMDGLALVAAASEHAKCTRCWHHREDVGAVEEHPELCGRCVDNVVNDGEKRSYA